MTRARKTLVSLEETNYYHCISRCVRRAWLCGNDPYTGKNFEHRRQWVLDRLRQLSEIFAIDICAYAVMTNHYHVVVHVDKEKAKSWSAQQVISLWTQLYKGHLLADRYAQGDTLSNAEQTALSGMIEEWRLRLYDISWFMRCLNEYLAHKANEEDNCKGRFFEGRFKSQALLDEGALLTCMSYVDLNPIRAGLAETPEDSEFTSIQERIKSYAGQQKSSKGSEFKPNLFPFVRTSEQEERKGIHFDEQDYYRLLDWTGRAIRDDKKVSIPEDLAPIMERLQLNPNGWLKSVKHYDRHYFIAIGAIDRMKGYAKALKKCWLQGQSAAIANYRIILVQ
jgi:REP element-mobilizing transposase RayT